MAAQKSTLDGVGAVFLLGPIFVASFLVVSSVRGWLADVKISGPTPGSFPVLVITDVSATPHARVVEAAGLPAFLSAHPDHSFLVPGSERELAQDLGPFASFSVSRIAPDRQVITLHAPMDDDHVNTAVYEATAKGFHPRTHAESNQRESFFADLATAFQVTFVAGVGLAVWFKLQRRRS